MKKIVITGIGTNIGKTIVAAILSVLFEGDYWKPVECGSSEDKDSSIIRGLINPEKHHIFPPTYSFPYSLSPHIAAELDNNPIKLSEIHLPKHTRNLIIEGVGGVLSPLNAVANNLDLFLKWDVSWIVVVRHYLGSINHTLLTLEALKNKNIPITGIIFNGNDLRSESFIKGKANIPYTARIHQEKIVNRRTITDYAKKWHYLRDSL